MDRTYLYVEPQEGAQVQAAGAVWDTDLKCWYVDSTQALDAFTRWLPSLGDEVEFTVVSEAAHVASATIPCPHCRASTEVICLYCECGTAYGTQLERFTVSDIWAVDDELAKQLQPWPLFHKPGVDADEGTYANHCRSCGVAVEDLHLHSEPDQPFFNIFHAAPGAITLTPLVGTVFMSGNEHFAVE